VKKAKNKQDVCPICKESRKHHDRLKGMSENPEVEMSEEEKDALKSFQLHRITVDQRKKDFSDQLNNLKDGSCILIIDFKGNYMYILSILLSTHHEPNYFFIYFYFFVANISLGKGHWEDSRIYFNAPQRTLFGAVAIIKYGGSYYKVCKLSLEIIEPILHYYTETILNRYFSQIYQDVLTMTREWY
jgi:hypothetical protein